MLRSTRFYKTILRQMELADRALPRAQYQRLLQDVIEALAAVWQRQEAAAKRQGDTATRQPGNEATRP